MSTTVEIETNERSEKLRWAPIITFSGADEDETRRRAVAYGDRLLSGFAPDANNKPQLRVVDGAGNDIGGWQID